MSKLMIFALLVGVVAAHDKIKPVLRNTFASQNTVDVIIDMGKSVSIVHDKVETTSYSSIAEKRQSMYNQLKAFTDVEQAELLKFLKSKTASYQVKGFWITNKVSVRDATLDLIEEVNAKFGDIIGDIHEGHIAHIVDPIRSNKADISAPTTPWGILKVKAQEAWAAGFDGEGMVVQSTDTGVRYTHESLRDNFRAEKGWYDPYSSSELPSDGNGHGTHVMGTIAGTNGIGVAPKATWIACRGCSTSSCSEFALLECGQFAVCPTNPDGSEPDCNAAPTVSANSWGGGQGDDWYNDVLRSMVNGAIVPVFANGNSGSSCRTSNSPGDSFLAFAVGSTTESDGISYFSSRGPSVNGLAKPEVSAPGSDVLSASNAGDDLYRELSGTSMACPHVAGAVAVVRSANPNLTNREVENALKETGYRTPDHDSPVCGDSELWPNSHFGHGVIDVLAAAQSV